MARPKSDRQVARVSVSFDADDYRALRDLAHQNDVSAAWIIRRAVTHFLSDQHAGHHASKASNLPFGNTRRQAR